MQVTGHGADFGAALLSMPLHRGTVGPVEGVVSGGLWAASAALGGTVERRSDNGPGMVSNMFGMIAGTTSALAAGLDSTRLSYASSASWLLSGGISAVQGVSKTLSSGRDRGASMLQAASGALNVVAATASGASTYFAAQASAQGPHDADPTNAHHATTAAWVSMGAWTLGSLAAMGSSYLSARGGSTSSSAHGDSEV